MDSVVLRVFPTMFIPFLVFVLHRSMAKRPTPILPAIWVAKQLSAMMTRQYQDYRQLRSHLEELLSNCHHQSITAPSTLTI
ncbi:hypothetical protein B0T20DRAFT_422770 [Sordaria brevicollis]|uniref:Uncharacterized protein n=1 Tax=Sordaria brevicollis TaxID=83679 RepID=A0AAE0P290_SORBR|nr:hypothetical protein B0T20DRAFT_422770 [Sordaria brevicollis]